VICVLLRIDLVDAERRRAVTRKSVFLSRSVFDEPSVNEPLAPGGDARPCYSTTSYSTCHQRASVQPDISVCSPALRGLSALRKAFLLPVSSVPAYSLPPFSSVPLSCLLPTFVPPRPSSSPPHRGMRVLFLRVY